MAFPGSSSHLLVASTSSTSPPSMSAASKRFIGAVEDEWQLYSDRESDYTIGSPIGFGASSIVYAATYQPQPAKPSSPKLPTISCALKVLDLDALPPRSLSLLQRETTLMSLSKHPNVLRVRGSWMNGHKLFIALRLMNKGSAADVMRYGWPGGMEEDVVRCILRQALLGLNYLHINGFIHRDVKAANLLIDDDGTVLLGDLGVAADLSEDTSYYRPSSKRLPSARAATLAHAGTNSSNSSGSGSSGTRASAKRIVLFDHTPALERPRIGKRKSFVGTPCWMAPELIQGHQYDSSADIWSFGITALELTQGRPPRSRETPQRVLLRTIQDDPPALDREGGTHKYSRAFKEVVDSCLVKDPSKRPTAADLLQTPFFKAAKKPSYLVGVILKDLPPLVLRQERRVTNNTQTLHSVDSWDFASTLHSTAASTYHRRLMEDMDFTIQRQAADQPGVVFEMEDEVVARGDTEPDQRRHSQAISWVDEPAVVHVQEETLDTDPSLSSSSASDSEFSSGLPATTPSPASSALSNSSPPSSFVDSKSIVEVLSRPVAIITPSRNVIIPRQSSPRPQTSSSRKAMSITAPSPPTSLLSSSPSQQGLWQKFKSNVRRPSRSDLQAEITSTVLSSTLSDKKEKSGVGGFLAGAGKHIRSRTNPQSSSYLSEGK